MNILFTFPKKQLAGAERVGLGYIGALIESGHSVYAIVNDSVGDESSPIPKLLKSAGVVRVISNRFGYKYIFKIVSSARDLHKAHGIDLVVSLFQEDLKYGSLIGQVLKVPHFSIKQSLRRFHGNVVARNLKEVIYGLLTRKCCDRVICVSSAVLSEQLSRFRVLQSRLVLNRNGIDLFCRQAEPSLDETVQTLVKNLNRQNIFVLVSVGRLTEQKGIDYAIRAIAKLNTQTSSHQYALLVVGEDPTSTASYRDKLVSQSRALGVESDVHFLGWQSSPRSLMELADMCVQPSRWEGLPLTVLEGLLENGVCVYSDCTGPTLDEFGSEAGLRIVPLGNVDELVEAIQHFRSLHEEDLQKLRKKSASIVNQHYDVTISNRKFVDIVNAYHKKHVQ